MSETLSLSGIEYIPAKLAGKRFGYTGDYIAKLAREGQVIGTKVGHQWFVVETSVKDFIEHKTVEKIERNEAIRAVRQQELAEFQKQLAPTPTISTKSTVDVTRGGRLALVETLVILIIGLSIGASGYVMTTPREQTASIASASYSAVERLAVALYSFITGGEETSVAVVRVTENSAPLEVPTADLVPAATVGTTTHTSLVVAPGEVFTATTVEAVRDSFSDDVSVSIDPKNPDTGIIIPHFREKDGEAYRFLLVPVNTNQNGG